MTRIPLPLSAFLSGLLADCRGRKESGRRSQLFLRLRGSRREWLETGLKEGSLLVGERPNPLPRRAVLSSVSPNRLDGGRGWRSIPRCWSLNRLFSTSTLVLLVVVQTLFPVSPKGHGGEGIVL